MICGGNFPDHLELWWSKHLYTPFDKHLDQTYAEALILPEDEGKGKRRRGRSAKSSKPVVTGPPTYAFHKRYVEDVSSLIKGERDPKAQLEILKQRYTKERRKGDTKGLRLTRFPQFGVAYILPQAKGEGKRRPSFALRFARSLVLGNLDDFIVLQETENQKLRNGKDRW